MYINTKLKRYFQINKHNLIGQIENFKIGYIIVQGNKPSSVAIHTNHAIRNILNTAGTFIEMVKQIPKFYS